MQLIKTSQVYSAAKKVYAMSSSKNGRLVKTVKFKNPQYVGDPVNAIKIFNDKEVDELIVVDINATKDNQGPNFELIRDIADECFMPVCYGGGIESIQQIKSLFSLGIEKVALNSHAMVNKNLGLLILQKNLEVKVLSCQLM